MNDLMLYSRSGCHLCEDAERLLGELGVPFERVEVSGREDLERLYGWDVPVLCRGSAVLVKGVFTRTRVRTALDAAERKPSSP